MKLSPSCEADITVFTRARFWSLSYARCIQSIPSHPISLRSIQILSSYLHLGLPSGPLPLDFSNQNFVCIFPLSYACYIKQNISIRQNVVKSLRFLY
jgi:hypothetical protein